MKKISTLILSIFALVSLVSAEQITGYKKNNSVVISNTSLELTNSGGSWKLNGKSVYPLSRNEVIKGVECTHQSSDGWKIRINE